jgi:hypothetical protein
MKNILYVSACMMVITGCTKTTVLQDVRSDSLAGGENTRTQEQEESTAADQAPQKKQIDFRAIDDSFFFTGKVPRGWEVEHVIATDAINIYDPQDLAHGNLEKSQIFIQFFEAGDFQTLQTVDVLARKDGRIGSRETVAYTIQKKIGVATFAHQPTWRSEKHDVVDVRFGKNTPTTFYVFARNPEIPQQEFDQFINDITFANEPVKTDDLSASEGAQGLMSPLAGDVTSRISKKPFGIEIDPATSPVQPERFRGFHTGTDFEVSADELVRDIDVSAVCDGQIMQVQKIAGYGGVITQSCTQDEKNLSILYGHVSLEDATVSVGDVIESGRKITELGDHQSSETDGERKHLHLGITATPDIRGYVSNQDELSAWYDFEDLQK